MRDGSEGLGEASALIYRATVLEQRCNFHTLQNVATRCRSELKGKENRDLRKQVLEQAAAVYHAENASEARRRLIQWSEQWCVQAPQSVATLERDFEQTFVFYTISGLVPQWVRTTSVLERTNRDCGASFVRPSPSGAREGPKRPSTCKFGDCMLDGLGRIGGKPLRLFSLISGISTLREGYSILY